jgi:hypothetical protein
MLDTKAVFSTDRRGSPIRISSQNPYLRPMPKFEFCLPTTEAAASGV